MNYRRFEINLISASDLEDVRERFWMKVYEAVTITGKRQTERRTLLAKENKTNPAWSCALKYSVGEVALQREGVMLVVKLFCKRSLGGHRYIDEVQASIKELYEQAMADGGSSATSVYKVQRGYTVTQGEVKLSCSFGEVVVFEKPSVWKRMLTNGAGRWLFCVSPLIRPSASTLIFLSSLILIVAIIVVIKAKSVSESLVR